MFINENRLSKTTFNTNRVNKIQARTQKHYGKTCARINQPMNDVLL